MKGLEASEMITCFCEDQWHIPLLLNRLSELIKQKHLELISCMYFKKWRDPAKHGSVLLLLRYTEIE